MPAPLQFPTPEGYIPTTIPPMGGIAPLQPVMQPKQSPKLSAEILDMQPHTLTGWELFAKTIIGFIIGLIIAFLLFVILSFVGSMFIDALQQQSNQYIRPNPLFPMILLFIGFTSTFIGNMIIAGLYNLFYPKKYYDVSKLFSFLLLTNGLLFFILAPIYLIFSRNIDILFFVLGFHVMFSVFLSSNQMEFLTQPNYSSSALMGNTFGFAMAILGYCIMYRIGNVSSLDQKLYLLMLLPPMLAYTATPLFLGIWEKIYYKFYEMGNYGFYLPSISTIAVTPDQFDKRGNPLGDGEQEEVNVEL